MIMDTKACSAAQNCDPDPLKLLHKLCFYKFWYAIFRQQINLEKPIGWNVVSTLLEIVFVTKKQKKNEGKAGLHTCSS